MAEEKKPITEDYKRRLLGMRVFWMNRVFNVFNIIENLKNREVCFLTAKEETEKKVKYRQLLLETYNIFKLVTEKIGFKDNLINIYQSVAKFKDGAIPISPLNPIRRADSPEYQEFNDNCIGKIEEYDFLIDLDGENFVEAYNQAKQLKEVLDEFQLPYSMNPSSSHGWHFWVEGKYFPDIPILDRCAVFGRIAKNIQAIYSLEGIDATIYDFRRVAKVRYSINAGDGVVCLPVANKEFDEELKIHQEKYFMPYYLLNKILLKNRGLLIRNLELGEEKLVENCRKFFQEFRE